MKIENLIALTYSQGFNGLFNGNYVMRPILIDADHIIGIEQTWDQNKIVGTTLFTLSQTEQGHYVKVQESVSEVLEKISNLKKTNLASELISKNPLERILAECKQRLLNEQSKSIQNSSRI